MDFFVWQGGRRRKETAQRAVRCAGAVHALRNPGCTIASYGNDEQRNVFAKTSDGFESRYFGMRDENSINEDPGTGSACANLGGWWLSTEGNKPLHPKISQGPLINRPNVLSLDILDGNIQVGGRVIEIGQGELCWQVQF